MTEELDEMGPIDYIVVEWQGAEVNGAAAGLLVDLVDKGFIRIIDIAFVRKEMDGSVITLDPTALAEEAEEIKALLGANSDLLSDSDMEATGSVLEPGTAGTVLVYENRWAAPFAQAVRQNGGQLVANGRIPREDLVAALDAADANS